MESVNTKNKTTIDLPYLNPCCSFSISFCSKINVSIGIIPQQGKAIPETGHGGP
jgi:hypothetical protein